MLSGKLPTGTVGTGDETDRARRQTRGAVPQRPDGPPRTTDRSGRRSTPPDRTDATSANATTAATGTASTATTGTGPTTTAPTASGTATADGTRTATPTTAGTANASVEPHAIPNATGGRKREAEPAASAENSRLRRRLSDERAERQAVIDHYERLLTERTMAAADCEEERRADTDTSAGAGSDLGDARAWLRRAISRLRMAWSRRG